MEHSSICKGVSFLVASIGVVIYIPIPLCPQSTYIDIKGLDPIECVPIVLICPVDDLAQTKIAAGVETDSIRIGVGHGLISKA